jgi:CubicO group peptidase (beta-lactamase class C family)/D-alanyl-D-alanine dipeptidase
MVMRGAARVRRALTFAFLATPCLPRLTAAQDVVPADSSYGAVALALERLIRHEISDKRLPSITIALVDDQRVVWAQGFGYADLADSTRASASTVHRVGSVSKLFTDIAIMQRVERGEIDLDEPVTRYLPDFRPMNPYDRPITLRHLMSHRSGLLREPPVGNYFDPEGSTLAAMVASVNGRSLVYQPGEQTKYSNAAIGVVGYVLERMSGEPFADALAKAVLQPAGMTSSSFTPTRAVQDRLSKAYMWTWDGRAFEAPTFELGMAPAGSMYSTVLDLGRFLGILFARGATPDGARLLRAETLEQMWTPQFAQGTRSGFGIGFALSELEGRRRIGHGGAIYGFATDLAALPDDRLGAIVVTTLDIANPVSERITDAALRMMLSLKEGRPLPEIRLPGPVDTARARALAGRYARGAERVARLGQRSIRLVNRNGELFLHNPGIYALRAFGDTLVVDDRSSIGMRLMPISGGRLLVGSDTLVRAAEERPEAAPARWAGLIGEYGWDHNTLFLFERDHQLWALIEWFFPYPLEEVDENEFRFPDSGLYAGERLLFRRDAAGRATEVEAASVVFRRREVGPESGNTFRITPIRPVSELRREALAATPPAESGEFRAPDLVELRSLDPSIRYDIRYATTNNFMGEVFYSQASAFLQRPAAEALVRAHRKLRELGFGLLIHDAYRPWYVTKMFFDATPANLKHFVADPASGSRHNRGAAVDLTLYELAPGQPVEMVSGYDEFSPRAYPEYFGGSSRQRWARELLRQTMEAEGFQVYEWEWWHFDFGEWRRYPIGNITFERIGG